jgi:hypothetical protein
MPNFGHEYKLLQVQARNDRQSPRKSSLNRRQFVGTAALAAAMRPALHAAGKAPPSGRVRIGLIGCGGRGRGRELLNVMRDYPDRTHE